MDGVVDLHKVPLGHRFAFVTDDSELSSQNLEHTSPTLRGWFPFEYDIQ